MRLLNSVFISISFLAAALLHQPTHAKSESDQQNSRCFPKDFLFGAATAAYQVEGGWNEGGRTPSIWDEFCRERDDVLCANVAGDFYHRYKSDIQLMKEINLNSFRFSISWSRFMNWDNSTQRMVANPEGVAFYHDLIDELVANKIVPVLTLYHWDLPIELEHNLSPGGWLNKEIRNHYLDFASLAFHEFGSKVNYWATFNEPLDFITGGYSPDGLAFPPQLFAPENVYLAVHNVLLSHGLAVQLFRRLQNSDISVVKRNALISIVISGGNIYPLNPDSKDDVDAAERAMQFSLGMFLLPLTTGNFPNVMMERSYYLVEFSPEEKEIVKGSYDLLMLNAYTSNVATNCNSSTSTIKCSDLGVGYLRDQGVDMTRVPKDSVPTNCFYMAAYPQGYLDIIKWVHEKDPSADIFLTESGYCGNGQTDLDKQLWYHQSYIEQVYKAITEEHISLIGYTAWSLIDNYEWGTYNARFGLYGVVYTPETGLVNETDPSSNALKRIARPVSKWYKGLAESKCLVSLSDENTIVGVKDTFSDSRSGYHHYTLTVVVAIAVTIVAIPMLWKSLQRNGYRQIL